MDLEISKEDITGLCRICGKKVGEIKDMRKCIVFPDLDTQSLSSHRSLFVIKETIWDIQDQMTEHDDLI